MSSYLSLHYHIVFSVKYHAALIDKSWRPRLHDYLGGIIRNLGGLPEGIGGIADHVHILMGMKSTQSLSDIMREIKKSSSTWVHQEMNNKDFAWQEGYAAFTISASSRDGVRKYIARQEDHHRIKSSTEELIEMLEMAGVNYDPKYLE